ncbi:hypothetical protein EV714DRAFT_276803 [Schizophyllum commune]
MAVDELTGPTLPQELLDLVLDHLGASINYKSLRACTLVHRCLLERSQQWLFREIRLIVNEYDLEDVDQRERSQPERLYAILQESPHLAGYVHTLIFACERPMRDYSPARIALHGLAQEKVLPLLLTQLPGLAKLELIVSSYGRSPDLGDALVDALAATSVVDLHIRNVLAPPRLLRCLPPRLEHLTLDGIWLGSDEWRDPSGRPMVDCFPKQLWKLTLRGMEVADRSVRVLSAAGLLSVVRELDMAQLGYAERTTGDKLFFASDRLHRLTMSFPRTCVLFYRLDISSLGSLRELRIVAPECRSPASWAWLRNTLERMHPLRRLSLYIYGGKTDEWALRHLDKYLANSSAKFECVDIHLDPQRDRKIACTFLPLSVERYGADFCLPDCL